MADEQVIKLLEEIRDLQRQHLENQEQVVKVQKAAALRAKIVLPILVFAVLLLVWPRLLSLFYR